MDPKVLMIAFHYPPCRGGSGIQRSLKFSAYLPELGWRPIVLSAHPRAYPTAGDDQKGEIPPEVLVRRAFALDTARHLSFRGAYIRSMALPDRWVSWWPGAVLAGFRLVRRYRPALLWSTFPIATAHLIGLALHRLTGVPWIADFRDSMTEENYPENLSTRRVYRWIERRTVRSCSAAVFTTPGAARMYAERYPEVPRERWRMIANGYDEENFQGAEQAALTANGPSRQRSSGPLILVHSGLIYPWERDPTHFFTAVSELKKAGKIDRAGLKVILRASGSEDLYRRKIAEAGIDDLVFLEPGIPYGDALAEMIGADGLLILQASNCNHQIPAKIYEYLRARRPILALTDPAGDTAGVLLEAGLRTIAPLDQKDRIAAALLDFLSQIREGKPQIAGDEEIRRHSRKERTRELAGLFNTLLGTKSDDRR